ncbi:MAG TPA: SPFH domain-containing protein [Candidatus Lokiarchaeia archaeon]|nr:SPFH domain-containing protein [Candidatus Lokiarchaeia archaeon]
MSEQTVLLLTNLQYCHIIDNNTGIVRLVEGPFRESLDSNEEVYGSIMNKCIVKEGQYAVIFNPYDPKIENLSYGDHEVRVGPTIFSLYPGELLEQGIIKDQYVLTKAEGLLLRALKDFDDEGTTRKAGERWVIKGPTTYIPPKYVAVDRAVKTISIGRDEGVYIKNIRSGEIILKRGPQEFMLEAEEELYEKDYTTDELEAFKLDRVFDRTRAIPLSLLKGEAALITSGEAQHVEFGSKIILLEPFETPLVMVISGRTPKIPDQLKIWKVMLGPVFSSDELGVRTKDNANLRVRLRYKWRFIIDPSHPEKIFAVEDMIGFATETMAGMIREEAAKHNFEQFHSDATQIIKDVIFNQHGITITDDDGEQHKSYVFAENGFEIFDIDVKNVTPEDPDIAAKLNAAISQNMDIYVRKIQQTAELEAQQKLIDGKMTIERARADLIALEQENRRTEEIGKAQIEADAIRIKKAVEAEAEAAKISKIIEVLQSPDAYIRLQQVLSFKNVEKTVVVPTDSRLFVPIGQNQESDSLEHVLKDNDE